MHKTIKIDGMGCGHCTATIEKALCSVSGVRDAKADLAAKLVVVSLDTPVDDKALASVIKDAGFTVVSIQ